jgi:hypothetical protein
MYKPKERAKKLVEEALDDIDVANESYTFERPESATFIMLGSIAQSLAAIALVLVEGKVYTDTSE